MNAYPRLIASVTIASVLLVNMPSALAKGDPNGRHKRDTIVTFTKWVTAVVPPNPGQAVASRFLMAGIVGGDVAGDCAGKPAGPCFEGTIRILGDSDDSRD